MKIPEYLELTNQSASAFANKVGMTRQALSKLIKGESLQINIKVLHRICFESNNMISGLDIPSKEDLNGKD